VSREQAAEDDLRYGEHELHRLARVDLLNLAAGWDDVEAEEEAGENDESGKPRADGDGLLHQPPPMSSASSSDLLPEQTDQRRRPAEASAHADERSA
jgi:hypothetical protein